MAEDIVACSGCGKKFRIPDGSPPSGKFACTACGADVAWGGAAAASAGGGGRKSGKSGRAAKGGKAEKASGGSRGARRVKGRKAREEPEEPETGGGRAGRRGAAPAEKENKTVPIVIAIMGGLLLIGILIVALTGKPPDYEKQAEGLTQDRAPTNTAPVDPKETAAALLNKPPADSTDAAGSAGGDGSGTSQPLFPVEGGDTDEESGIGGVQKTPERAKDYRFWFGQPLAELFVAVDPVEGTSDEEVARIRELAQKATDFYSGAQGVGAERELSKIGRKAMPFLMNRLVDAWGAKKWEDDDEKFACFKVQQLAREITKADGPPSEFFVRFPPGPGMETSHFQRAAQMWMAWWRGEGQYIEEFKAFADEE